jgi:hypothetical protein
MPDYVFRYLDENGGLCEVPVTHVEGPSLPIASQTVSKRLRIRILDNVIPPTETAAEDRQVSAPALP